MCLHLVSLYILPAIPSLNSIKSTADLHDGICARKAGGYLRAGHYAVSSKGRGYLFIFFRRLFNLPADIGGGVTG